MTKLVGSYFAQILIQALILGGIAYLVLLVPGYFKVIFAIAGLYLFWRIPKDPRTHWKRMFSVLMGAALIGSGIEGIVAAGVNVPPWLRADLALRFIPDLPPWLVFGLAVVIAVADVATELLSLRKQSADGVLWGQGDNAASKVTGVIGQRGFAALGFLTIGLRGGTTPLRLTHVTPRLKGVIWWIAPTEMTLRVGRGALFHEDLSSAPPLQPNDTLDVQCALVVKHGWKARLLFWWRRNGWRLLPRTGAIEFQFDGAKGARLNVPLEFAARA